MDQTNILTGGRVMQAAVLGKMFGTEKAWHGPCFVVLNADVTIQTFGTDAIVNAGTKLYAPRLASGRITVDAVCFVPDDGVLVVQQVQRIRQSALEDQIKITYFVLDPGHVAAFEFADAKAILALGLTEPPVTVASTLKPRG